MNVCVCARLSVLVCVCVCLCLSECVCECVCVCVCVCVLHIVQPVVTLHCNNGMMLVSCIIHTQLSLKRIYHRLVTFL